MKTLRWGIIGAGDIVKKRVAPAINDLPDNELIAVARSRAELAEASAKELGARRWYADWREMLADDEIDAVYIATPVFLHAEQTIAAAEAAKHVLCEKPMAMNVEECDRMIAASEANSVRLGIAYYRRFYPVLARVREILKSGEIGRAVVVQINAFEYQPLRKEDERGWFVDSSKSGGGPMMDFGCHRIEVLTDLFGEPDTQASLITKTIFDRDVEDTAALIMECSAGPLATVTVTHGAFEPQDTLSIYGTNGSIHVPVLNTGDVTITTAEQTRSESHPPHANIHLPLIADFADAVRLGRDPRVGGDTGRMVAAIEDRIYGRV